MKEGSQEFLDSYKQLFNMDGNTVSVYFYEAMRLYYKGLMLSGKIDSQSVKNAILSIESFDGVFESFRLDKFGDAVKKMQIYNIRNGDYEIYR